MICSFFAKKEPKKLSSKISRRVTPCGIFLWEVPVLPCKQGTHRNEPVGRGLDPAGEWAAMWAILFARKGRKISTKISRGGFVNPSGYFSLRVLLVLFRVQRCRSPAPLHPKQEKNSPLVQLNITTSSLGFSPGSTLRAVSTGPVASGVWPW